MRLRLPQECHDMWMDNEDTQLVKARNAKDPVFPFDRELLARSVPKLNQQISRLNAFLKQSHSHKEGVESKQTIRSCMYHTKISSTITGLFTAHINPLRVAGGKWADRAFQVHVIQVVKTLFRTHQLPLHVSYPKLYNMFTNVKRNAKEEEGARKTNKSEMDGDEDEDPPSKRARIEEDDAPPGKRARIGKHPDKTSKAKGRKPTSSEETPTTSRAAKSGVPKKVVIDKPKVVKQPQSTAKKAALKQIPRIGSDGITLRVGPCRLGDTTEALAQGTVISINPTITGTDVGGKKTKPPWGDGVLCRFTSPILNAGDMQLEGVVFQVSTFCLLLVYKLYTNCLQIVYY